MSSSVQPYADNGVVLSKSSLTVGDDVVVSYSGLLARSGADQIFAHVGYGENWQEKAFVPMESDNGTFKAEVKVKLPGVLNISFKDSANNWDNNSSNDYSFKVSEKIKGSTKASESKKAAPKEKSSTVKADSAKKTVSKAPEAKKSSAKGKTAAKEK